MNVTLINMTTVEVPLSCTQGDGFAVQLDPGAAYAIDDDRVTVVTVGENASLREDVTDFLDDVRDALLRLVTFWRAHAPKAEPMTSGAHPAPVVKVMIDNSRGVRGLRVLQGDDRTNDFEIGPREKAEATGLDYVELRELGVGEAEDNTDQTG